MTSGNFRRIDITTIIVDRPNRQRREVKPEYIADLADSIKRLGLIHPIVLTETLDLIAGECRLAACKALGWTSIPAQFTTDLPSLTLQLIELEENVKRNDIDWRDRCNAVKKYHDLRKSVESGWRQEDTAGEIGMSLQNVSRLLAVAEELPRNSRVAAAPKLSVAAGIVKRSESRRKDTELDEALDLMVLSKEIATAPAQSILNESFLNWAPSYSGPRFNFLHCDFPYGIGADKFVQGASKAHGGYEDSEEAYWQLLRCLSANLNRLCLESSHIMFWFSMRFYRETLDFFAYETDFTIDPFPLIWMKTDNVGILPDPTRGPRRIYETAFFGSRGDRRVVKSKANAYGSQSQRDSHMSIKPEPMLKNFMEMFVDGTTSLLDPTCGSGSALRAAEALGAKTVLGLEVNPEFAENANKELDRVRKLRSAG